ncbi:MAG: acyl carrier protein [Rubrivivax sp.]|nr:acyl carrier protein [Rubrivivax sp.]
MNLEREVIECVADALSMPAAQAAGLSRNTQLLGHLPEFNSLAVVALLTALEDRLGHRMAEDLDASAFVSIGTLIDTLAARPGD